MQMDPNYDLKQNRQVTKYALIEQQAIQRAKRRKVDEEKRQKEEGGEDQKTMKINLNDPDEYDSLVHNGLG